MFQWLLTRPTSLFGFLSGIFISVATTALSNVAFAATPPENQCELMWAAALAFVGGASWFALGEFLQSLRARAIKNQAGIPGDEDDRFSTAVAVVAKSNATTVYGLLAVAILFSLLWAAI